MARLRVGLKFSDASGGDATINVYKSTDRDGSSSYLTDEEAALAQISAKDAQALGQVTSGDPLILPTDFWTGSAQQNPVKCFLFEGYREGKGQLVLTVHKGDGTQIGEAGSCWLDLMNIKKMYQRARATPEFSDRPYDHMDAWSPLAIGSEPYDAGQAFSKPEDEDSNVIVYVHGINGPGGQGAEYASWMADSETVFKRLWHQGYKGRFAAFKWLALTPALPFRFNESEYRAWKCGRGLARFVDNLPSNYSKNLYSFSQGAPVCGAALTVYGLSVDNYVMSQAAAPAGCYDTNPSINSYADFLNAEATTPTPDTTNDLGYREYLTRLNVSGAVVSFYNTTDYALKTGRLLAENVSWEGNQITYKPNANLGTLGYRSYAYDFGTPNNPYPVGQRCFLRDVYAPFNYRQLTDIHESMSFVARPRSEAAGANTSVGGSISGRYNVGPDTPTNLQNSSNDHGGQFSRRIQQTWPYYENLVGVFVEE